MKFRYVPSNQNLRDSTFRGTTVPETTVFTRSKAGSSCLLDRSRWPEQDLVQNAAVKKPDCGKNVIRISTVTFFVLSQFIVQNIPGEEIKQF